MSMSAVLDHARLVVDLLSMKLFVWLLGTNGELLDSHLFFYDRYSLLADFHRTHGRDEKADRFTAIAESHFRAAPDDDGPEEAAMAMAIPQPPTFTKAVSARALDRKPRQRPRTGQPIHAIP